jgi:hypothetical protein
MSIHPPFFIELIVAERHPRIMHVLNEQSIERMTRRPPPGRT